MFFFKLLIDLDSFDIRISSGNNEILDSLFRKVRFFELKKRTKFSFFSHVEHIINETVRLFSLGSLPADSSPGRILPLHFVALLDPEANWFRTWMVRY